MKRTMFGIFISLLFGCSSTPAAKWNKETASKSCFDAATKGKYDLTDVQLKKVKGICDCVGEKMAATFKTEKEANEKMLDAAAIANECKEDSQNK